MIKIILNPLLRCNNTYNTMSPSGPATLQFVYCPSLDSSAGNKNTSLCVSTLIKKSFKNGIGPRSVRGPDVVVVTTCFKSGFDTHACPYIPEPLKS